MSRRIEGVHQASECRCDSVVVMRPDVMLRRNRHLADSHYTLKFDPAVASSPFVTTVTDVVGFFSFLSIASLWFGLR